MPDKPKIALYWCAGCGGCEESVVDLAEDILMVTDAVDIVFWPVALDFKKKGLEEAEDGSILATLINGAVRTGEQEEMARLLRAKSKYVIAHGACAHLGGIPSLANQFSREQILRYVYEEAPTVVNETQTWPQCRCDDDGRAPTLPEFRNRVRSLDQVVQVDYYLPGCPPTTKLIKEAVLALLSGQMPPFGSVLAPDVALCEQCKRLDSKPQDLAVEAYRRPHLMLLDPELCFLAQGVACMGPATRGGCESLCIQGNMPCTGCFGPTSHVLDQGAKILSFLASSVAAKDEAEIERSLAGVPDPVGTFYRYGFAKSIVRGRVTDG